MRQFFAVIALLLSPAVFASDDPGDASVLTECKPSTALTWAHVSTLDAQARNGFWLGMSRREFLAASKRNRALETMHDDKWDGPGDDLYVVSEVKALEEGTLGVSQVLLFEKDALVSISESVQNARTSGIALRADEAHDVLRDYSRYMCWRFGKLSATSPMGARARGAFLGPVQVMEQLAAGDQRVAMDAFVAEDLNNPGFVQVLVVTRLNRFGR